MYANLFKGVLFTAALVGFLTTQINDARAEPVPEQYLDTAYKNCLISARPHAGDLAVPYCGCMKERLRLDFTKQQFEQLDREASGHLKRNRGDATDAAAQMPRLQKIVTACNKSVRAGS